MKENNLRFKFQKVTIHIKWIPGGWLAMMMAKDSTITMETIPDKDHTWKPQKEDWQNISIFGAKGAKSIKTPEGWLIYIFNNVKLGSLSSSNRIPVTHVCTKYIHDPKNVFVPDETEKIDDLKSGNDAEEANNHTNLHHDEGLKIKTYPKSEELEPISGYYIRVESCVSHGATNWSSVNAETLDELKDILRNKYGKRYFTLISSSTVAGVSAIHNQRKYIPLKELNDEDCQWLSEKTNYDVRHLE